jgi:hypothetical protein
MNNTGLKFGGRSKGTPNKNTAELRDYFQLLINDNLEQIREDIDSLEPKDRIKVFLELSKFVLPTLKATETNNITEGKFNPIIVNL